MFLLLSGLLLALRLMVLFQNLVYLDETVVHFGIDEKYSMRQTADVDGLGALLTVQPLAVDIVNRHVVDFMSARESDVRSADLHVDFRFRRYRCAVGAQGRDAGGQ